MSARAAEFGLLGMRLRGLSQGRLERGGMGRGQDSQTLPHVRLC